MNPQQQGWQAPHNIQAANNAALAIYFQLLANNKVNVNSAGRAALVSNDIAFNFRLFHNVQEALRLAWDPNTPHMYVYPNPICFITQNAKDLFLQKMDRAPYMFNRYGRQVQKVEGLDTVEDVAAAVRTARANRRTQGLPPYEIYVYWVVRPEIVLAPQSNNSSNGYEVHLLPQLWINRREGFPTPNRLKVFSHQRAITLRPSTISTHPEYKVFDYFRPWLFGTDPRFRDIGLVSRSGWIEVAGCNTLSPYVHVVNHMVPGWSELREVQEFAERFITGDRGYFNGILGGIIRDYTWESLL